MSALIRKTKRLLFKLISRSAFAIYSWFPIFGDLRGALAIVRNKDLFLVINRSDGRGYSFPGGVCNWKEPAEQAMRREVREETGLEVQRSQLLFEYRNVIDVRSWVSVFTAEARGSLQESWEGVPLWVTMAELRANVVASQVEVLNRIT